MNKEELIKFIESIEFEAATNFVLTYHKKVPKNGFYCNEEDKYNMEAKTITFNKDFEGLLNERATWLERRIDDIYLSLNQRIEEKNEGGK